MSRERGWRGVATVASVAVANKETAAPGRTDNPARLSTILADNIFQPLDRYNDNNNILSESKTTSANEPTAQVATVCSLATATLATVATVKPSSYDKSKAFNYTILDQPGEHPICILRNGTVEKATKYLRSIYGDRLGVVEAVEPSKKVGT